MTKQEFLDRCSTAWDAGYISEDVLVTIRNFHEITAREYGNQYDISKFIREYEEQRMGDRSLASDSVAYKGTRFLYLLTHPCQLCATDKSAWHTRYAFCEHK